MASVTGITSAKAQEIENATVVDAFLSGKNLILETFDGTQINVGLVAEELITLVPSLVTVGSFDSPNEDVVVPEWNVTPGAGNSLVDLSTYTGFPNGSLTLGWSPDGLFLALGSTLTPYITVFNRTGEILVKISDPSTLPGSQVSGVQWSPDGQYLACAVVSSPYVVIYKRSGTTLTKLTNPATLPAGQADSVSWSPDGAYLVVSHATTPFITIYKRSGDTFTKLANPSALPVAEGWACAWSPNGIYLAVGTTSSPRIVIYKRSGDTFTKLSDPASLPITGVVQGLSWSADSQYLAAVHTNTPWLSVYRRSVDTFTKIPNPATNPGATSISTAWSPDMRYLVVTTGGAPYYAVYRHDGDLLTRLPDMPVTIPFSGSASDAEWSPGGELLAIVGDGTTPLVLIRSANGLISGAAVKATPVA